jgi:glycosyltransferase involved in cell wall biosynthesis
VRVLRWCHRHGIRCFLWGDSNSRGDLATGAKRSLKRIFIRKILRYVDGVMVCGSFGKEYFTAYGAGTKPFFYVPYEPDYDLIANLPATAIEQVRARFGLTPGRRRIVFSGRLVPVKRPDLLIEAFIQIAPSRPLWDLVMVGHGPMRGELESRIPESLRLRVIWTGFIDDQATVSALYRSCDVLVLPSDYEPWALVINEAVAAGLAVVTSDVVGAAAELVRNRINGQTFPRGDLQKLVYSLQDVTEDGRTDVMKAASSEVLADWRRVGDPVDGLRNALRAFGVITEGTFPGTQT